jgi:ABC-type nitrate/sulfonate/bicarbonate transport system substrate-binding protein
MRYRKLIIFFSLFIALLVDRQTSVCQDQGPGRTFRIVYEYAQSSAPLLVAQEKGFFSKRGIVVELRAIGAATGASSSMNITSDEWDIAVGVPLSKIPKDRAIFDYIRLIQAQCMTRNSEMIYALVVKSGSGIKKIEDLKRKKMLIPGMLPGLQEMLNAKNIPWSGEEDSVKIHFSTGDYLENFMEDGDCSYAWGEDAARIIAEKPKEYSLLAKNLPAQYICDPYYLNTSFVRLGLLEDDKEAVVSAIRAMDDAIAYMKGNPKTTRKIIQKYFTGYSDSEIQFLPLPEYLASGEEPIAANLSFRIGMEDEDIGQYYLVLPRD